MKDDKKNRGIEYVPVDFDPFRSDVPKEVPTTEAQKEIIANISFGGKPASCAYNESVSLLLTGSFSRSAFTKATVDLVERHEALRSVFSDDGTTVRVFSSVSSEVEFIDLTDIDGDLQGQRVNAILDEEAETEFNFTEGPLFRFRLLKLKEDQSQVILTFHHLICDGWSLGILMQDLGKLYSFHAGTSQSVLDPAPSFIAANQREIEFQGSAESRDVEQFWLNLYSDELPSMEMEIDRPRPRIRTYNAHRIDMEVPEQTIRSVREFGARYRTSYISTLIALFECYLSRITGSGDITLGLPSAGQAMQDDQNLVGHYVNMLPLRSKVDPSASFADYLSRRRNELLDAYEHQRMTFGRLLNLLKVKRDPSRIPLIPVSFNVDLGITNGVEFKDCEMRFSTNPRHYENHEIFINAAGDPDELILECTYNTDLFDEVFIRSRLNGFLEFMDKIVTTPEQSISDVNILSTADLQLFESWCTDPVDHDRDRTINSMIYDSVKNFPDRVAVEHEGQKFTYRELHQMALSVAQSLKGAGIGKECFVGVCMKRTPMMVASLLGVMYSGAAYVPLDVDYPEDRLRFILEDSGSKVVLTDEGSPEFLSDFDPVRLIDISEAVSINVHPSGSEPEHPDPSSAAYVIYTSGSTGKPKGVVIEHMNAVALFAWAAGIYDQHQMSGVVASTSICFDLSVFEILNTLAAGGRMILINDITALPQITADSNPTLVSGVPSAVSELERSDRFPQPTITTFNLAGEPLSRELVDRLYGYPGVRNVYDLYGPSEDTTYSTWKLRERNGPEVIGKVLPNSRIYLVGPDQKLVQPGLVGEIWISGEKVARGYLNRDELSNASFIQDPFQETTGRMVYKTGDLAKFNKNGDLIFMGRTDHQVKIRGYRIEPGEIESKLLEHQKVNGAVCIPFGDPSGSTSLVCYYESEEPVSQKELTSHVSRTLPSYMIPSSWIHMKEFPLTLNGKLDRKKLPDPEQADLQLQTESITYEEPEGPFEEALSGIFSEVLGVDRVGRRDDFFELGGHSLLGVRVANLIDSRLGIKIALQVLFTAPTVQKLAAVISGKESGKRWSSIVPLKKDGSGIPLFCVHMHNGNVHRWRVITRYMDEDQPVYAIQPQGLDPKQEPHRSVEEMATYYVEQVQKVQPHGPYRLLGLCFSGMVVFEMAVIFERMGEKVEFLGMVNNYAPPENPTMYKLKTEWNKFMRMEIGEKFNYAIQKNVNLSRRLFVNRDQPDPTTDPLSAESVPVIGNDLRSIHSLALLNYHPEQRYNGDLTIIRTDEPIEEFYNEHLGWDRLVTGAIRTHIIAGCDNDTIITDHPYNRELSLIVRDHLGALNTGIQAHGSHPQKKSPGGASSAAIL